MAYILSTEVNETFSADNNNNGVEVLKERHVSITLFSIIKHARAQLGNFERRAQVYL